MSAPLPISCSLADPALLHAGNPDLEKSTAFQCLVIFCLRSLLTLTTLLGRPEPSFTLSHSSNPISATWLIAELTRAIRATAFDGDKFVSGPAKQVSWASAAFAVLAGVSEGEEARTALKVAYEDAEAIQVSLAFGLGVSELDRADIASIAQGNTPYLHHYLVEAFIAAGLDDLALKHIKEYWGSVLVSAFSRLLSLLTILIRRSIP